jgi:fatty acid desaturase
MLVVAATMVPQPDVLPDVLPTERLLPNGMPIPELRASLRRIQGGRNAITIVLALVQSVGVFLLAGWLGTWWAYVAAYLLVGRGFALLAILGHEAAHRLLFKRRWLNDGVGRFLVAALSFTPLELSRRSHLSHHRDELGPTEPDLGLYSGYPITRASLRRKLTRDAFFNSGWKNLKPLLRSFTKRASLKVTWPIALAQLVLFATTVAMGCWWLYPVLWLAPFMSVWRVINRLRAIAEHGGMAHSDDKRMTTHVVRQTWLARFWIVPYNTGWHLAHHVDMGVPWRKLPALHQELVDAGWVVEGLEHRSYTALWKALSSRPEAPATSASPAAA